MSSVYSAPDVIVAQPVRTSSIASPRRLSPEEEGQLIVACQQKKEVAYRMLYDFYSPLLMSIAMRYATGLEEAEDILQEGFIKIYKSIGRYKPEGSFEGWLKRIVVNTAINQFHRSHRIREQQSLDNATIFHAEDADALHRLSAEELLNVVRCLPEGYRMVFNLYVIEGYDHGEIGKKLNISESTSRSQLAKAKKRLK
ncbi:MAG: sigma-70 family RNA polymerase sigma factor, partial [Bacteroidota bacterium]